MMCGIYKEHGNIIRGLSSGGKTAGMEASETRS
jgi:hypothetical protein